MSDGVLMNLKEQYDLSGQSVLGSAIREIERLSAERDQAVLTAMERNTEIHDLRAEVERLQNELEIAKHDAYNQRDIVDQKDRHIDKLESYRRTPSEFKVTLREAEQRELNALQDVDELSSQVGQLAGRVTRLTNILCWVRDNMEASGEGTEEAFNMIIHGLKGGYADE